MGFSINTTKPLSAKPEKKKLRRRTKRDKPDPITGSQVYRLASAPIGARTNHRSLLEAVSQREFKQPALFVSQCTSTLNPGSGAGLQRSNAAGENQSPGPGSGQSYRQIAYNEYLAQAFGLAGEDKGDLAEQPEDLTGVEALPSTQSDLSTTSMELSFRLSLRERRPKIQLTIPRTRSKNYAAIPQEKLKGRTREGPDTSKTISPPSTTSHHRVDSGGAPAKLSIVSPLSVVEMPKPRRPFTTFSFEEMTEEASSEEPLLSKSAISDSSDDTGDHDGKSSSYSARSSVSSLASDPAAVKSAADQRPSLAFSVMSPTAAGVFDPKSKVPSPPRAMRSMTSLQDGANRNKPLPPAPGPGSATPWSSSTHPFARTNSMKTRHKSPAPLCVSRQSTMSISSRMSLRSKYTPTDLSDIDNALQPGSPRTQEPCRQTCPSSPTLSQAELELEAHLCSIEENVSIHTQEVPLVDDPLQISRGPMHMEPSRKPPPLPPSPMSTDNLLKQGKKQTKKLVTHVAMQMRPGNELDRILRKRVSAPAVGSNDKAHRVLGRSCKAAALERHASAESRWESSESPHSSPNTSMDDSETPTSERSPLISDAAFEEVRQRLELLSPKNDASQVFQEFHEQNFSNAGATARPRHEASVTNPLDDTKSVKSSSRQIAAPKGKQRRAKPGSFPPVTTTPAPQEHHAPLPKPRTRYDQPSPHYRGSIAAFKLTEIHASLPSPRSSAPRSLAEEERERMISAEAAEKVLLCILENLDNLQDLFATATVSRGFYRTFKRHELHLMMNSLYAMSPAAWELREMSPPLPAVEGTSASSTSGYTPTLYLQHYMTDMYTMIALKSVILVHCESFLRADTITALAGGERASQIDDAFWRVWTFCRLFGCGTNREDDIVSQMDWLRGGVLARQQRHDTPTPDQAGEPHGNDTSLRSLPTFGQGNRGGLTAEELYDMTEIWTCLGVLVSGFQGKRELAREFGIFDNPNISGGDVEAENAALEEWTYHLLTLAPPTILDVTSPTSPTATTFAHARSRGYTTWSPPSIGISRSTFLKEAVSRVYQEKMLQRHPVERSTSAQPGLSAASERTVAASRQRMAAHAAEIRAKRNDPAFKALLPSDERPMSNFPDVLRKLENSPVIADDSSSTATPSSLAPSSQLFPSDSGFTTPPASLNIILAPPPCFLIHDGGSVVATDSPLGPQVRDPVDIALEHLIEMGFEEAKATKALADTDTGNSVDFEKALEILVRQRKRDVGNLMNWNYCGPITPEVPRAPERRASPKPGVGLGIGGAERYA